MKRNPAQIPSPLDSFIPTPDVRERFQKTINAPANIVMEVACNIDLQSLHMVHMIFWLRDRFMRTPKIEIRKPQGLIDEMSSMGWGLLAEKTGQLVIYGSACQPWLADPGFKPIPPDQFLQYDSPDQVKIAWTLEAESLGPSETRFIHETRVVTTDAKAKSRFMKYWRWARFGIIGIRLILMPAIRRSSEKRWKAIQGLNREI